VELPPDNNAQEPASAPELRTQPVSITRPGRRQQAPGKSQPSLFDRGTGTYGPWPYSAPALSRHYNGPIPANVAVREILAFIDADPNTLNWSGDSKEKLAETIITAAYRAGHIGLWERGK
jgi:hypothetical protein